jgi:hypothetical protein
MLLAAYDARRPTTDRDALAQAVSNDQSAVVELVIQIAHQAPAYDDGVEYRAGKVSSRIIQDEALYSGVRIAMDCAIATAVVKFRLDVKIPGL